jgi:hypothetical protein
LTPSFLPKNTVHQLPVSDASILDSGETILPAVF